MAAIEAEHNVHGRYVAMSSASNKTATALAFAERLAGDLAAILGDDLVGVYLHGSLALHCFNPARSDVDLLVVTQRRLSPSARRAVAELMLARSRTPYPVEVSVLSLDQLRPWRHPARFDFHYSEKCRERLERELAKGELPTEERRDRDLAAHVMTLRARGRRLRGAPIAAVFPDVPEEDYLDSILHDLDWIRDHSTQIYGVLNACRVIACLRGEGILSKAEAAEWALAEVPTDLRPTVAKALAAYRAGDSEPCPPDEVRKFVAWARTDVDELLRRRG